MASPAQPPSSQTTLQPSDGFSQDFPLDAGIFGPVKITLAGSGDASAAQAILSNGKFPDGNIALGNIAFTADTPAVSLKPETVGGASVSFQIGVSARAQLVRGATDALTQVAAALNTAAMAPTQAIKALAKFAADLTDTFNQRVTSLYSGMSGRVVGPMLLVESSSALGSPGANPAAMLTLYTLNPGHTFDLGKFIDGTLPPQSQVAPAQTLVSLKSS